MIAGRRLEDLQMKRRTIVVGTTLGGTLAAAGLWAARRFDAGAEAGADGRVLARGAAVAFGTTVGIAAVTDRQGARQAAAQAAIARALAATQHIDRVMSLHRPDSQLSRLNRESILRDPDPHLRRNLEFSLRLAAQTGGAFDMTIQPLWALYARSRMQGRLPDRAEIDAARRQVDWTAVEVSERRIRVRPGMAITLNAVAQGYAADVACAILADAGFHDALVDTGEFGAVGSAQSGAPWTLGLQHPRDAGVAISAIRMDGRFLATSGDYATTFTPDFVNHHIIDPARGRSPRDFSCVAVAAPTGLQADGLATALMLLDRRRGAALLAHYARADAVWIDKASRLEASRGMPLVKA